VAFLFSKNIKGEKWMKTTRICLITCLFLSILASNVFAHYGMVIPSDTMVMQGENRVINISFSFSHPFEGKGMELAKPNKCEVVINGKKKDLLSSLKETKVMGHKAWIANYKINRPGVYSLWMEPKAYWEPAEDCYIVHYTKTVVAAFGQEEGWDEPLGLKTEIVPLTRPFGLYAGNVFQGVVMLEGKPVPYAEVEVEYYNEDGKAVAPTDYMVTQVIKADKNGVLTYAAPVPGWWGFAALNSADYKLKHNGQEKDVELGAVLWVKFEPWQSK
jgi:cobalt/nickel transport protein